MKVKKVEPRLSASADDIDSVIAQMSKLYGEGAVVKGKSVKPVTWISTGVAALDFITGGGFPINRCAEIRGMFSSLKTTVTLKTIKAFQQLKTRRRKIAAYVDFERTFDPSYATKLGINNDDLLLLAPDSGEQASDMILKLTELDADILVIVDSIAAMTPSDEIEASADQQFMGLQARMLNRFFRRVTGRMRRGLYIPDAPSFTLIAINQLRQKVGVVYGSNETTPGGEGKNYYYSVIMRLSSSPSDRIMEKVTKNGVEKSLRVGQNIKFSVLKNKCSSSQHEDGEVVYYVRDHKGYAPHTFDNDEALFRMGVYYGVIKVSEDNPKEFVLNEASYSEGKLKKLFREDESASEDARLLILDAIHFEKQDEVEEDELSEEEDAPKLLTKKINITKKGQSK